MKKSIIVAIGLLFILSAVIGFMYLNAKINKVIVIDVIKVVNEFKLKKELEKSAESKLMILRNKVDSVSSVLEYALKNNKGDAESINKELQYWQQKAYDAYEVSNNSINEQVWKRLNPLIDEFGKQHNYRIVIGANGMGTVLYNADAVDKSNELIQFINTSYDKGEK